MDRYGSSEWTARWRDGERPDWRTDQQPEWRDDVERTAQRWQSEHDWRPEREWRRREDEEQRPETRRRDSGRSEPGASRGGDWQEGPARTWVEQAAGYGSGGDVWERQAPRRAWAPSELELREPRFGAERVGYRDTTGVDDRPGWADAAETGMFRGRGPRGYRRSDERIREDVCEALWRDGAVDASDVEVDVASGIVTLRGRVEDRDERRRAEDLACAVRGVLDVDNDLKARGGWRSWLGADREREPAWERGWSRGDASSTPDDWSGGPARTASTIAMDSFGEEELWTVPSTVLQLDRTIGYDVDAEGESVGKVDEATTAVDASYLIVDTGWWIFGRKRMVPAGVVRVVDHDLQVVHLAIGKHELSQAPDYLSQAPDYEAETRVDDDYRWRVASYFAGLRAGTR